MHCMKCGTKIEDRQVFCTVCLEDMAQYPVKPNTHINLPIRPAQPPVKKKSRRGRDLKPEEQLRLARKAIRNLAIALAVVVIAFVLTATMLLRLMDQRDTAPGIGQNYGSMSDTGK